METGQYDEQEAFDIGAMGRVGFDPNRKLCLVQLKSTDGRDLWLTIPPTGIAALIQGFMVSALTAGEAEGESYQTALDRLWQNAPEAMRVVRLRVQEAAGFLLLEIRDPAGIEWKHALDPAVAAGLADGLNATHKVQAWRNQAARSEKGSPSH